MTLPMAAVGGGLIVSTICMATPECAKWVQEQLRTLSDPFFNSGNGDGAPSLSRDFPGTKSAETKGTPDDPNDPDPEKKNDKPDLKKIHSDETIKKSNKTGYDYWKNKSTDEIVRSLRPGQEEPLTVKPDGRVYQGNTRVLILEERGVNVNSLPRDIIR